MLQSSTCGCDSDCVEAPSRPRRTARSHSSSAAPVTPPSPADEQPRTMSGKRPSAASIQRGREYMDWLASLPTDFEDSRRAQYEMSRVRDESYERFMKLRRVERDRARWKKIVSDRRIHRSQQQQELGTKRERPINPDSQRQRKLAARAAAAAAGSQQRRGRPVNPNSKRQQKLAARAKHHEQRKVEEQGRAS